MVARKDDAELIGESEVPTLPKRVLLLWQRMLTRLLYWFARLIIRPRRPGATATQGVEWVQSGWVTGVAIAALLGGVAAGVLIAPAGQPRLLAIAAGAASVLWAALRLLLMRLSAPCPLRNARALRGAWAVGLVAYAIGVTPELRLAAWVISGGITWYVLQKLGEERREATLLTGVAWGTQAAVVVLSWLARSAYVAIVTARG